MVIRNYLIFRHCFICLNQHNVIVKCWSKLLKFPTVWFCHETFLGGINAWYLIFSLQNLGSIGKVLDLKMLMRIYFYYITLFLWSRFASYKSPLHDYLFLSFHNMIRNWYHVTVKPRWLELKYIVSPWLTRSKNYCPFVVTLT